MKQQTFIFCVEQANGYTLNFERCTWKKAETCIANITKLYRSWLSLYRNDLSQADYVTLYATPDGFNKTGVAWRVTASEFLAQLES